MYMSTMLTTLLGSYNTTATEFVDSILPQEFGVGQAVVNVALGLAVGAITTAAVLRTQKQRPPTAAGTSTKNQLVQTTLTSLHKPIPKRATPSPTLGTVLEQLERSTEEFEREMETTDESVSSSASSKYANVFVPQPGKPLPKDAAVLVIDPISTGANVADAFLRRGMQVVAVTSGHVVGELPTDEKLRTDYLSQLCFDSRNPSATLDALSSILDVTFIGVVVGSELGIECGDFLSSELGLPSNGVEGSEARRDKYLMQEVVRSAGLKAIKQTLAKQWLDVAEFAMHTAFPLVLKPSRSAGSDHIFKVSTVSATRDAFDSIIGQENALGEKNESVVVQQFLEGTEYIVDTVSSNGKHKVVAVWEYDKRSVNGQEFVYFGMRSVAGTSETGKLLVSYTLQVLDSLGIKHGAGHAEVILTKDGPCLVEVGARPQGCEGTFMPLSDRVWGYNQVDALAEATLATEQFKNLPDICGEELEHGFKVDLVCCVTGMLKRIDHMDRISTLPSFMSFDLLPAIGSTMQITIDCFTSCGSVSLAHHDQTQLDRDVSCVREYEKSMWILE